MTGPRSRLSHKMILASASLLVTFLLLEVILHLFPPPATPNIGRSLFCKDPVIRRRMRPNVSGKMPGTKWQEIEIRSNRDGYRDTEWLEKKARLRVMFLGDSFGWGWGCRFEKMISRVLEGKGIFSVYNLAIPGDGINDYYVRYNVYHDRIKPHIVLILMYANDFFVEDPISQLYLNRAKQSEELRRDKQYVPQCISYPLNMDDVLNTSYMFRIANRIRYSGGITFSSKERRLNALRMGFAEDLEFLSNDKKLALPLSWLSKNLTRMKKDGIPIIVANIPPSYSIDDKARKRLHEALGPDLVRIKPQILENHVEELCRSIGVEFVSLAEVLRKSNQPVYFEFDSHLNENGQVAVGSALHSRLLEIAARHSLLQ